MTSRFSPNEHRKASVISVPAPVAPPPCLSVDGTSGGKKTLRSTAAILVEIFVRNFGRIYRRRELRWPPCGFPSARTRLRNPPGRQTSAGPGACLRGVKRQEEGERVRGVQSLPPRLSRTDSPGQVLFSSPQPAATRRQSPAWPGPRGPQ